MTVLDLLLVDEDEPRCRICGCTETAACEGGCWWIPDPLMLGDLCSACLPAAASTPDNCGYGNLNGDGLAEQARRERIADHVERAS